MFTSKFDDILSVFRSSMTEDQKHDELWFLLMGEDEIPEEGVEYHYASTSGWAGGCEWTEEFKTCKYKGLVVVFMYHDDPTVSGGSVKLIDHDGKESYFQWVG